MPVQPNAFIKRISNPLQFKLFLLKKLPAGYFTGLKIETITADSCTVSVPYKWFNKNPFRSTYFASLAMAAELSTGALAMANVYGKNPPVSLLVIGLEASYFKKATSKTFFTCNDGQSFTNAVNTAIKTTEPQVVKAQTIGVNASGEEIARFTITWSFKSKT